MGSKQASLDAERLVSEKNAVHSHLLHRIGLLEQEIATLKRSEAALQIAESKWRELVFTLPDIVAIVGRDLTIQYINRAIPELDVRDVIGTSVLDYVLPAYHDLLREQSERVLETGEIVQFETQGRGPDGSIAWYSSRVGPFNFNGDPRAVVHVVTDITELKVAEKNALTNERKFRILVENAPLCIFEVDLSVRPHRILMANRRTELLYGWPPEWFHHLSFATLFSPHTTNTAEKLIDRVNLGHPVTLESEHLRHDGITFPVRISATPETVAGNQSMIVTVEDISIERNRRSEMGGLDQERQRIAHEIHDGLAQNLAAMRLRAVLWRDLLKSDPQKMHDEIELLLTDLKSYIGDVRRSIFALRPIALDEQTFFPALRQFISLFNQYYAVQAKFELTGVEAALPEALELPLFRIVQEALNNVGQHASASNAMVELNLRNADVVVLLVRDDGIGFDPIARDQLVQAEHLGLKHMRERVESFGGTLLIQTELGVGTEIRAVFPHRSQL